MLCQFEKLLYPKDAHAASAGSYMVAVYRPCEIDCDSSGSILPQFKAVGYLLPVSNHLRYDMKGHWSRNTKHGTQFEVDSYDEVIIPSREGIIGYSISDVIRLLGLPPAPVGRLSYYIPCPCCDSGRDRHMNINLQKDVFRCPRCGEAGGIFDLYSLYTGTPRAQVKAALTEKLGAGFHSSYVPPEPEDYPLTDVATRHTTYSALLNLLTLSQDHRENLLSRGLSDEEITRLRYRTTPVMGHTAIAKQLQDQGCYLAGVPGFFRTEDGNWALTGLPRGILIPVRNVCGQIQGLQLRKDNSVKRKFRWVSSMGEKDGCGAECWTHLAGPAADTLILTEGPMKADVIHALTGLSVLAVPGVNGLSQLSEALLDLQRNHGLENIKTAFDMDYTSNYHVQTGYAALYALLDKLDLTYSTYLWDPRYKGLDDYIWESLLHKQRAN